MQAFAVGVPSGSNSTRDPGEPPSAKRKQIEMRQRQLDSLKRMEERYKSLEKKTKDDEEDAAAAKAKEPKLSPSAKQEKVRFLRKYYLVDSFFLVTLLIKVHIF